MPDSRHLIIFQQKKCRNLSKGTLSTALADMRLLPIFYIIIIIYWHEFFGSQRFLKLFRVLERKSTFDLNEKHSGRISRIA